MDRAAVQRDLTRRIVEFVRLDNQPASVARQSGAPSKTSVLYAHGGGFSQILLYTPPWVWALLAGLSVFGLMQVRTRRVPMWLALLMPAAMLVLSVTGVLQYVGWSPFALAAWPVLGLSAVSVPCLKIMRSEAARYDTDAGKLIVAGSWIPLLMILAIFSVRYAMGVAHGMEFQIIQDLNFQLAVSMFLGGFSGFFLARGILFWATFRSFHAGRAKTF